MEKLIELLNEYENTDNWENWHQVEFRENRIISKKFWFIKWLVEKEKIDFEKLYNEVSDFCEGLVPYPADTCSLMLLSIQDEPIEFLISILK